MSDANAGMSAIEDGVLDSLVRLAIATGADSAVIIPTSAIRVEDHLADLCNETACDCYGQAASCPPHVGGPREFRELLNEFSQSLFLKIDVSTDILMSEERWHVYHLLHRIVSHIRKAAVDAGFTNARAFAGGSCKKIFCRDHADCRIVHQNGSCRHPDDAQPSMSGFGINVFHLMQTAGWQIERITRNTSPASVPVGSVSGLVLVA
jgi:predicted metal-binding protein